MPVNITEEMYNTFIDNGLTEDDIQYTVNYYRSRGQSDDEIFNNLNNKYKSLINTQDAPKQPERPRRGAIGDFVQGAVHGLTQGGTNLGAFLGNELRGLAGKEKLMPEQIKETFRKNPVYRYTTGTPEGAAGAIGNFAGEMLPYTVLPGLNYGRAAENWQG